MRRAGGVVAALALIMIGALLWGEPATSLWERTFAPPCPAAAPSSTCLATLTGRVESRFNDYAEADVAIALEIPDAPADTETSYGHSDVTLTPTTADRLGITWNSHDVPVTVTLFHGRVVALTGPTGQPAQTGSDIADVSLRLLLLAAASALALTAGGRLWRRQRGGQAGWPRRVAVSVMVGTLAGVVAGAAVHTDRALPTIFAVMVVASLAVAIAPVPRALVRETERVPAGTRTP